MAKATTIKEAIVKFEERENVKACEAEEIKLCAQKPPIEKMDASLSTLVCCVKLSLSTNCIEKIANLNGLKHLKILSLSRNGIKSFAGLEAVCDTLEELWMSYNCVEKLKGVVVLKKLKVLYLSNNLVKEESELDKLKELPCLEQLVISGNPVEELCGDEFPERVKMKIPRLKKLNGVPVVRTEQEQEQQEEA